MKYIEIEGLERRKSPQQKKKDEYDKDMRPRIENPHAFRKNWPKKKARINRKRRKHIQEAIQAALARNSLDNVSSELLKTVAPFKQVKKQGIISLRQDVEDKIKWRRKS